jgi:hypothetical protein
MRFQIMILVVRCIQTELPTMPANIAKPNLGDDELQMIWGAAAIGAALNLNTRQAFLHLEAGRVPGARKFGRKWVASGAVLRRVLTGEAPPVDA